MPDGPISGDPILAPGSIASGDLVPIVDISETLAANKNKSVQFSGLVTYFNSNLSFNNYVHPNHSGDVTSVADGAQTIAANAVTLAKMADLVTARILGRVTTGTGDPEALTGTQATTLLDVFTSVLKGLVPASGGGTTNFLRADGTFAAPPGGGGNNFGTITVTDTNSGYTWAETASVVSDASGDTVTLVSGADINIDADATLDAIKIALKAAVTGVTTMYNSALKVGYNSSNYMGFNALTSFGIWFDSLEDFRFVDGGEFHANGNVLAYSTTISSDRKLKKDFDPIEDAVGKILGMHGYTYTLRKTGERKAGLVAQDVQQVLPEAVCEKRALHTEDPFLALDYNGVIGVLVEAVKALHERIKSLERRL